MDLKASYVTDNDGDLQLEGSLVPAYTVQVIKCFLRFNEAYYCN